MSKFKEGDIIVKDGYTYVCKIAGEDECLFSKRWFRGLFKNPDDPWGYGGCGGQEGFSCTDYLILKSDKKYYNNPIVKGPSRNFYPVIGNDPKSCGHTVFYNSVISFNYPEEYTKYVTYLYNNLPENKTVVSN